MQFGVRRQTRVFKSGDLVFQHEPKLGVFVTDVDICLARLDNPGSNQHAFDEAVRIALEIVAILESARLAFVGIDCEHSLSRFSAHERPFATGRKARAS